MKYPLIQLTKAYYDALNSAVLPVYDGFAPEDSPPNYIVITDKVITPMTQDTGNFTECVLTFDVNTKTKSFGFKSQNVYVNQFTQLINADTVLTMADFTMDNQVIEDIQPLPTLGGSENQYRTIIRVRAYLTEK